MDYFLGTLFIIICVLLIVVVLLQKGRGGGLGAAFGGATSSSAFGARIGDVFTWVTIVLAGLFLLLAVGTTMLFRPPPTPVNAPVFSPAATDLTADTVVKIDANTPRGKVYYTLDGSEPKAKAQGATKAYVGPITVKPGTTIKAVTVLGGKTSDVATGSYPQAAEKPEMTVTPATATAPAATTSAPATPN